MLSALVPLNERIYVRLVSVFRLVAVSGHSPDWPSHSVQAWPVLHYQHRHASVR
jgi:hypothetical protein